MSFYILFVATIMHIRLNIKSDLSFAMLFFLNGIVVFEVFSHHSKSGQNDE